LQNGEYQGEITKETNKEKKERTKDKKKETPNEKKGKDRTRREYGFVANWTFFAFAFALVHRSMFYKRKGAFRHVGALDTFSPPAASPSAHCSVFPHKLSNKG
jgi:hypothetical protein